MILLERIKKIQFKKALFSTFLWLKSTFLFVFLLFSYIGFKLVNKLVELKKFPHEYKIKFVPKLVKARVKLKKIGHNDIESIAPIDLIELSMKNMKYKLVRTLITIGGISIGIAAIVFLVSLGYGLEQLVKSRVARLEERRQVDVFTQTGSGVKITDASSHSISMMDHVEQTLPVIALVAKISYQESTTDVAVYGVTTEYLKSSAIQPVQGEIYQDNVLGANTKAAFINQVEAMYSASDDKEQPVEVKLKPGTWYALRSVPELNGKVIGYVKSGEVPYYGYQVVGEEYPFSSDVVKDSTDTTKKEWIRLEAPIWQYDEDQEYTPVEITDTQLVVEGYLQKVNMSVSQQSRILGIEDERTQENGGLGSVTVVEDGWVEIEGESIETESENTKTVELGSSAIKEAVVNRSVLSILGLDENDAVGKNFSVSYVITSSLLESENERIVSNPVQYEIVGVIPQEDVPFFYVPFSDLKSLGIDNYSQLKVVLDDTSNMSEVREKISVMGFATTSVVDTEEQIESLFDTLRIILALVGTIALLVASLGMFNTLTISLLERTREIGLMKAMGMRSFEVKDLFLTESMVMGIFGGIMGIVLGFIAGKIVGFLLSVISVTKGLGYIDITYIPFSFVVIIMALSLIVGVFTGIYPSKRATKISAMNALRYE